MGRQRQRRSLNYRRRWFAYQFTRLRRHRRLLRLLRRRQESEQIMCLLSGVQITRRNTSEYERRGSSQLDDEDLRNDLLSRIGGECFTA